MSRLAVRPAEECRFDLVALGEIMLRLDPGVGRIRNAREFQVWEGRRRVQRRPWLTPLLRPAHRSRHRVRRQRDRAAARRLRPAGRRRHVTRPLGCHRTASVVPSATGSTLPSAASASGARWACPTEETRRRRSCGRATSTGSTSSVTLGVRWLHTGGIFAALSETTPEVVIEAVEAASNHGTICRTISIIVPACGRRSAASNARRR